VDHDLVALLPQLWPIAPVRAFQPRAEGSNNHTWQVDTATGAYILRAYPSHARPAHVRHEHAILAALAAACPPFAVPAPLVTRAGPTYATLAAGAGRRLLALAPLLPGSPPDVGDPAQVRALGAALGALHRALAPLVAPPGAPALPPVRAFLRPAAIARALAAAPLDPDRRGTLAELLARASARAAALPSALPRQIVHRDFDPSNVLLIGGQVGAVLDFEFAAVDLRVVDLALALHGCVRLGMGGDATDAAVFVAGYAAVAPLTAAECRALPTALLLGRMAAFLHRLRHARHGSAGAAALAQRLDALVVIERQSLRLELDAVATSG